MRSCIKQTRVQACSDSCWFLSRHQWSMLGTTIPPLHVCQWPEYIKWCYFELRVIRLTSKFLVQSAVFAGTIDAEELKVPIRYKISSSPVVAFFTMTSLICKLCKNYWTRNCIVEVFCYTNLVANLSSSIWQDSKLDLNQRKRYFNICAWATVYSSFLPFYFADFDHSNHTHE